jgi:hypothetical protein
MSGAAGGLACRRPLPPLLVTQRRGRPDSTSECSCGCFRMWDRPEEHQSAGRPLSVAAFDPLFAANTIQRRRVRIVSIALYNCR